MIKRADVFFCAALVLLVVSGPGVLGAQAQGRIVGEVVDPEGQPIRDAVVEIKAQDRAFSVKATTSKKGKFVISLTDATWDYQIRIEKEGYMPVLEPVKAQVGGITSLSWTLVPGSPAAAEAGDRMGLAEGEIEGSRPVVKAYEKGAEAFSAGDFAGALAKFLEAVELDPELKEGYHAMAMAHHNLDQPEQALALVERFDEFGDENAEMEIVRFDSYERLDRLDEAAATLERLIELAPGEETARRAFNLGVKYYKQQDLEKSIAVMSKAAAVHHDLIQAHRVLAQVLVSERRYQEALVHADHALGLDPEDADGLLVRYESLRGLGRENEGETALEQLKTSSPEKFVQTFMRVGLKEFELGQNDNAIRSFQRVVEVNPDHPQGNYRLGVALVSAEQTEAGVALLKKFIELAPDDPEAAVAKEMLSYLQ